MKSIQLIVITSTELAPSTVSLLFRILTGVSLLVPLLVGLSVHPTSADSDSVCGQRGSMPSDVERRWPREVHPRGANSNSAHGRRGASQSDVQRRQSREVRAERISFLLFTVQRGEVLLHDRKVVIDRGENLQVIFLIS